MDPGISIHDLAKALSVSTRTLRRRIHEDAAETGNGLEGVIQVRGRKVAWVLRAFARNPEYRFFVDAEEAPDLDEAPRSTIDRILDRLEALERDVAAMKRERSLR